MLMKLTDLTTQIAQEVGRTEATLGGEPYSGVSSAMHLVVTTEGENNALHVVTVPLQNQPGGTGGYGTPIWGPCQAELRAVGYHDPYVPGTIMADTDGTQYIWVADTGFQPLTSIPGSAQLGPKIVAVHKALDDLTAAVLSAKK